MSRRKDRAGSETRTSRREATAAREGRLSLTKKMPDEVLPSSGGRKLSRGCRPARPLSAVSVSDR
jgi:hypothetical protein